MNHQKPIQENQEDEGFEWNGRWVSQESIEKSNKEFMDLGGDY